MRVENFRITLFLKVKYFSSIQILLVAFYFADLTDELAQKLFVVSEISSTTVCSLPTAVPESSRIYPARIPKTPRTPRLQDPNKTPRFYPVVKESKALDIKVLKTTRNIKPTFCIL